MSILYVSFCLIVSTPVEKNVLKIIENQSVVFVVSIEMGFSFSSAKNLT